MIVQKFGGTSVGSAERIKHIAELIRDGKQKVVVLSAMSGTTNALVELGDLLLSGNVQAAGERVETLRSRYLDVCRELLPESPALQEAVQFVNSEMDALNDLIRQTPTPVLLRGLVSRGEIWSTRLFYLYLRSLGHNAQLLVATDFLRLSPQKEPDLDFLRNRLGAVVAQHAECPVFIIQGFICLNAAGEIDNLQRGGSDYSATLIGAALQADEIQIWTDIDGLHNNDPRVVDHTRPVRALSFEESGELAYFGAKILHPSCIQPARKFNIPVRLLNTLKPDAPGTLISGRSDGQGIKAIAAKDQITAIRIKSDRMLQSFGFLRKVFAIFEEFETSIDMITTSEVAVSMTIDNPKNLGEITTALEAFCEVKVDTDLSIICVVGEMGPEKEGYAFRIFETLKHIPLRMISYGGSDINISLLVETRFKVSALQALHQGIFEAEELPAVL